MSPPWYLDTQGCKGLRNRQGYILAWVLKMARVYPSVGEGGIRRLVGRVDQTFLFSLHSIGKQPPEAVCSQKVPPFHPPIQVPSLGSGPSDNSRGQVY